MPTAGPLRSLRLCAFLFSRAEIAEAAEMANSAFPCPERSAQPRRAKDARMQERRASGVGWRVSLGRRFRIPNNLWLNHHARPTAPRRACSVTNNYLKDLCTPPAAHVKGPHLPCFSTAETIANPLCRAQSASCFLALADESRLTRSATPVTNTKNPATADQNTLGLAPRIFSMFIAATNAPSSATRPARRVDCNRDA